MNMISKISTSIGIAVATIATIATTFLLMAGDTDTSTVITTTASSTSSSSSSLSMDVEASTTSPEQATRKEHRTDRVENKFHYKYLNDLNKEWKFIHSKGGIDIYEKRVHNDSPVTFRGIGIVRAPIAAILHAVREVETAVDWTPNLSLKKIVHLNSHIDGITYNVHSVPWPATNRDTVIHSKLILETDLDPKYKFLNVISKSVEVKDIPEYKDRVRAVLHRCGVILKPLGNNATYIDIDAQMDAKGMIPKWFVNFLQKDWPHDFIKSLEKHAQSHPIANPHPEFLKLIKEVITPEEPLDSTKTSTNGSSYKKRNIFSKYSS
ncbi:MAG: hypothetical protein HQK49_00335 [Oligoflexia bacterium]|nr:hypothetical protein [Oligoflexia bacterium]